MPIKNRFLELLLEKETKEKRKISIAEVSRVAKVDQRSLGQWSKNEVTRYDAKVVEALCKYFECEPGKLIIKVNE